MSKQDVANGNHYKGFTVPQEWVGQPLDPALLMEAYPGLPMLVQIIVKKGLRYGSSIKTSDEDLLGVISAAERQLVLNEIRAAGQERHAEEEEELQLIAVGASKAQLVGDW